MSLFVFSNSRPNCYCYPYTYSHLQYYLERCQHLNPDILKRETIGFSNDQRRLDLVKITDPYNMNTSSSTRTRSIFVTSRIRPGDSPSSFVCQGLIDFLVSSDPRAQSLRSHLVFMIVPMVNPDGVALGNYHSSLLGFDLNRHWKEPSVCVHPEIYAVKNCLISLDENMEASLDFFVDILATESLRNGLVFGNALQNEENDNKDEIRSLAGQQIENSSPSINLHASEGNCVPSFTKPKQKSPGGIFGLQTLCYTLEVSFFGYMGCNGEIVPYTEELYTRFGRNLALTFYEFYQKQPFPPKPTPRDRRMEKSLSLFAIKANHVESKSKLISDPTTLKCCPAETKLLATPVGSYGD